MENKFGADIITLTDEDNNEYELEHIDTIELNKTLYLAFTDANQSDDPDSISEIIILRLYKDENGEEILSTVDDEKELEAAYAAFMEEAEEYEDEE